MKVKQRKSGVRFSRIIMVEISCYDWRHPTDICFRPVPFMAPRYFSKAIHVLPPKPATT